MDQRSVRQLTCFVGLIRKEEGIHDELLGRRVNVRQVPLPPAGDRLDARLLDVCSVKLF